jgi:hypothetical protein
LASRHSGADAPLVDSALALCDPATRFDVRSKFVPAWRMGTPDVVRTSAHTAIFPMGDRTAIASRSRRCETETGVSSRVLRLTRQHLKFRLLGPKRTYRRSAEGQSGPPAETSAHWIREIERCHEAHMAFDSEEKALISAAGQFILRLCRPPSANALLRFRQHGGDG